MAGGFDLCGGLLSAAYHVLGVVLPLGSILTLIYLRTRNLLFTMIIHFMIDLAWLFLS
jgi:membrane protease YdiL (CAAX protease family)